jgi:hypothetical protein
MFGLCFAQKGDRRVRDPSIDADFGFVEKRQVIPLIDLACQAGIFRFEFLPTETNCLSV